MEPRAQRAVIAERALLDALRCQATSAPHALKALEQHHCPIAISTDATAEQPGEVFVHPSGWKFHSFHRHILHAQETKQFVVSIKNQLFAESRAVREKLEREQLTLAAWKEDEHLDVDGFHLHVPPMLFGADLMLISTPAGGVVNVSALDAIYSWVSQHTAESIAQRPLDVPKVPFSHGWMASMRSCLEESRTASTLHKAAHGHSDPAPVLPDEAAILNAVRAYDWTFSNDYCISLLSPQPDPASCGGGGSPSLCKSVVNARDLQNPCLRAVTLSADGIEQRAEGLPGWSLRRAEACGIDYEMLKRRDLPILFYDELTLYQDDLEDCGEVVMEAKLRVMPTCWFLLSKLFVRVDQKLVRSRETRLYHAFSADSAAPVEVQMEVVWKELAINHEVDPGRAMGGAQAKSYTKDMTNALPQVNERDGVHQFYTLTNARA